MRIDDLPKHARPPKAPNVKVIAAFAVAVIILVLVLA